MGTGYVRIDTSNNIADGGVIDASDLDGEFNALVESFSQTVGHTHDGSTAEGAPVTVLGPAQEFVGDASGLFPKTTNTYTLGKAGATFSNIFVEVVTLADGAITSTAAEINKLDGVTATTAEINKLDGVTVTTAELNLLDGQDQTLATTDSATFVNVTATGNVVVTGTVDGRDVAADGTKLDTLETGATSDQTASQIKAAYEGEANAFTDAQFTKLSNIETGATADQTGAQIKTAYEAEANAFTDSQFTKLGNVEVGATADQTGAQIKTAYEGEANAFTDSQFTKLGNVEVGATADQTGAQIKTAYEAEANAFTDTLFTKLSTVETNADVTDTVNVTSAGALMDSEVTNLVEVKSFAASDYATATQGGTADSALQPDGDGSGLTGIASAAQGSRADQTENLIINGAMQFAQRDTSGTGDGYVAVDRWRNNVNGGTVTQSRQAFTLGDKFGNNNPKHYLRQVVTGQTAANHYGITNQRIEDVRSYAGETVTVLGWVKRSAGAGDVVAEFVQNFGTGGSPSDTNNSISITDISVTSSWEPFAAVMAVPSITGKTLGSDNNDFLGLNLWSSSGSDLNARTNSLGIQTVTVEYWGIHIKRGTHAAAEALNYVQPEPGPEFMKCQRYYEKGKMFVQGSYTGGNHTLGTSVVLAVVKRANPTFGLSIIGSGSYSSSLAAQAASTSSIGFNAIMSSGVGAFLFVAFTADAEL